MNRLDISVESACTASERTNTLNFESAGARGRIFWRFSGDLLPVEPPDLDFALVAMLPYCMRHGLSVRIHGPVSRGLVEAMEECMDLWTARQPAHYRQRVGIDADELRDDVHPTGRDAVLTFSGGVDASFALIANQTQLLGQRSVNIATGVMVQGFDIPLNRPDWFHRAVEHSREILREQNVALTTVQSDWRNVSVDWHSDHSFGLFAVLHQFHGRTSGGVIAADVDYREAVRCADNSGLANHILSARSSFPVRVCGGGNTRTEKVAAIAPFPAVRAHVRVCWEHPELGGNCGVCEKCVRTQLNFLAAGVSSLPAFAQPLTPAIVRGVGCKTETQRRFLQEVLDFRNGRELPPDIRAAVGEVLGRPLLRPSPYRVIRERLRVRHRVKLVLAKLLTRPA